jgi:hypothetical protein
MLDNAIQIRHQKQQPEFAKISKNLIKLTTHILLAIIIATITNFSQDVCSSCRTSSKRC